MLEHGLLYVLRADFQSDGWFIRLRFDCQRVQSVRARVRFSAARIRFVRGLRKAKRPSFYRARFVQLGRLRRL